MQFGGPAIGTIDEGGGLGYRATGRDLRDLMAIGCLAIGNPEEMAGFGGKATGIIVKMSSGLRVHSSE